MPHHRSFAGELNAELLEHIRGERPPLRRKRRILFTVLLIFQVTLLLVVFPSLFVYFENRAVSPELETTTEIEPLNSSRPIPTYLDGLIWSLYTPLTLNPDETWPQTRPGQILVRVSDVTKVLMIGTGAALFHDTLTNRHVQKNPVIWYGRRQRRPAGEEGEESEDRHAWVLTVNDQRLVFHDKTTREIAHRLVELLIKLDEDQQKPGSG